MSNLTEALNQFKDIEPIIRGGHLCIGQTCPVCVRVSFVRSVLELAESEARIAMEVTIPMPTIGETRSEEITHIWFRGRALCDNVKGDPTTWPERHYRVGPEDAEKATCHDCMDSYLHIRSPKAVF